MFPSSYDRNHHNQPHPHRQHRVGVGWGRTREGFDFQWILSPKVHSDPPIGTLRKRVVDSTTLHAMWYRPQNNVESLKHQLLLMPDACFFVRPANRITNAFHLLHLCKGHVRDWQLCCDTRGVGLRGAPSRFPTLAVFIECNSDRWKRTELPQPLRPWWKLQPSLEFNRSMETNVDFGVFAKEAHASLIDFAVDELEISATDDDDEHAWNTYSHTSGEIRVPAEEVFAVPAETSGAEEHVTNGFTDNSVVPNWLDNLADESVVDDDNINNIDTIYNFGAVERRGRSHSPSPTPFDAFEEEITIREVEFRYTDEEGDIDSDTTIVKDDSTNNNKDNTDTTTNNNNDTNTTTNYNITDNTAATVSLQGDDTGLVQEHNHASHTNRAFDLSTICDWDQREVLRWLHVHRLNGAIERFVYHDVVGKELVLLTLEDLQDMPIDDKDVLDRLIEKLDEVRSKLGWDLLRPTSIDSGIFISRHSILTPTKGAVYMLRHRESLDLEDIRHAISDNIKVETEGDIDVNNSVSVSIVAKAEAYVKDARVKAMQKRKGYLHARDQNTSNPKTTNWAAKKLQQIHQVTKRIHMHTHVADDMQDTAGKWGHTIPLLQPVWHEARVRHWLKENFEITLPSRSHWRGNIARALLHTSSSSELQSIGANKSQQDQLFRVLQAKGGLPCQTWSTADVASWFETHRHTSAAEKVMHDAITGTQLMQMSTDQLRSLGVSNTDEAVVLYRHINHQPPSSIVESSWSVDDVNAWFAEHGVSETNLGICGDDVAYLGIDFFLDVLHVSDLNRAQALFSQLHARQSEETPTATWSTFQLVVYCNSCGLEDLGNLVATNCLLGDDFLCLTEQELQSLEPDYATEIYSELIDKTNQADSETPM